VLDCLTHRGGFLHHDRAHPLAIACVAHHAAGAPPVPPPSGFHTRWIDPGWRRTVVRYAVTFDERG